MMILLASSGEIGMAPIIRENSITTNKAKKSKKIEPFHLPNLLKYWMPAVGFDKCFSILRNQSSLLTCFANLETCSLYFTDNWMPEDPIWLFRLRFIGALTIF